jgi:acetyl-CoA synthetase
MSTIESTPLVPAQGIAPSGRTAIESMDAYRALVAEAAQDHEAFWARLARAHLSWRRPFTHRLSTTETRRSTSGSKTAN